MNRLTPVEEKMMMLIWQNGGGYLKDFVELLSGENVHQNTISTYLKILTEKGFITARKEGRINFYMIAIPKEEYASFLLVNLLEDYYDQKPKALRNALKSLPVKPTAEKPDKKKKKKKGNK